MRVHIICARPEADRVLPRLARYLRDGLGWSLGERPDPHADINYFFNYIEWAQTHKGWKQTLVAAWFTHLDVINKAKATLWENAAAGVDLRTVTAQQYATMLAPSGPTEIVLPPVELDRFVPVPKRVPTRPIVGVSGYVYADNRKGEKLFAQLAADDLSKQIELRACGRGWTGRTTSFPWAKMPSFYQGLDVYLCTSHVEGVPMPPLEAMACGTPVVIPKGVGLLDELPDLQNIYRYEAGDYADMVRALKLAVDDVQGGVVNVASLRGVSQRFTIEGWCKAHQQALEGLLYGVPEVINLPPWKGRAGVYYVAYGKNARACATRAMKSFRDHMSGVPICLVSDAPLGLEDVFVEHPDEDVGGRSAKTKIFDLAPKNWDYVLFLDADTEVVADISFLFQLLEDGWEAVFCINPAQYHLGRELRRPDNKDECEETYKLLGTDEFLQLNGGVFTFRRNANTERLMRDWHREWHRYGRRDQAALDRALYANPLRLYVLGNEWNTITRYVPAERTAGILHYPMTARRWKGILPGRLDSDEAWARVHPNEVTA